MWLINSLDLNKPATPVGVRRKKMHPHEIFLNLDNCWTKVLLKLQKKQIQIYLLHMEFWQCKEFGNVKRIIALFLWLF